MSAIPSPLVFDKGFHDITISDLESLITNEVAEGLFIEYKRAWPENRKVAASVCSFANAHGGYLAIGIRADKDHNKPVEITGIDLEEGLNDRVKNIVLANVHPVPIFESRVIEIPTNTNKAVLLVRVEESSESPHILIRSGVIYVRNPSGSDPIPADDRYTVDQLYRRGERAESLVQAQIDYRDLSLNSSIRRDAPYVQVIVCPTDLGKVLIPNLFTKTIQETVFLKDADELLWDGNYMMMQDTLGIGQEARWFLGMSPNGLINYWHDRVYSPSDDSVSLTVIDASLIRLLQYAKAKYAQLGYYSDVRVCLVLSGIVGLSLQINQGPIGKEKIGVAKQGSCHVNRTLMLSDPQLDLGKVTTSIVNEVKRFFGIVTYDEP